MTKMNINLLNYHLTECPNFYIVALMDWKSIINNEMLKGNEHQSKSWVFNN